MIAQYLESAHQEQAAAKTFSWANSIVEQFSQPYRIAYTQHAIEGNGCQLAASVTLAEIDGRVGHNIGHFDFTRAGELARNPFALVFFLD